MVDIASSAVRPASVGAVPGQGFVEWGPVFAGGAMAAAVSFVLLTFGAAIGLSFVSPWSNAGASTRVIASIAIFWTMAQQIGAAMIGGYIAGRMRSRWGELNEHEVEFRDGLHGGLVWAVGLIIAAALAFSTAGAVAKSSLDAVGRAASIVAEDPGILGYQADVLLRSTGARVAAGSAPSSPALPGSATTQAATPSAASPASTPPQAATNQQRDEIVRILGKSVAAGGLSDQDSSYLAALVSQRTGLSQSEAEKRVKDAYAETSRATKEAADKARRAAILTGFVTAAGLLVALGAAWWAAQRGGHHRDNSVPARFYTPTVRKQPLA
jgi:hypothetical protein